MSEPFALVIVGGGNMGAALVGGLLAAGSFGVDRLAVCEAIDARRGELAERFPGVAVTAEVPACDAALLAVKPGGVADATRAAVAAGARRLLSIAAGVTTASIEAAAADPAVAVVRAMPNTPALVGKGATAIAPGAGAGADDLDWAEAILASVGTVERVDESDLDAITALSGSGPGYLFLVAEALIDAGERAGLDAGLASRLVRQLFVGSADLLARGDDPATLRAQVTSPGGTTAAGIAAFDEHGVRDAFVAAVAAAAERSRELAGS